MAIWLQPAWQGWQRYITDGKLPALLFAIVLYLLLAGKARGVRNGARGKLLYFGAIASVCCVFPVTALFLMKYQTLFYDYPFIWSVVPMTALIAFGGTVFLGQYWKRNSGWRGFFFNLVLTVLCAFTLFISGGTWGREVQGEEDVDLSDGYTAMDQQASTQAGKVLQEVWDKWEETAAGKEGKPCLIAPREVLEYARMQGEMREGASFELLYGRNMWDIALNAYTYDVYPEEVKQLYEWMEQSAAGGQAGAQFGGQTGGQVGGQFGGQTGGQTGAQEQAKVLRTNVEKAFSLGADCVLLPKTVEGVTPESVSWAQIVELEQYYLLMKV